MTGEHSSKVISKRVHGDRLAVYIKDYETLKMLTDLQNPENKPRDFRLWYNDGSAKIQIYVREPHKFSKLLRFFEDNGIKLAESDKDGVKFIDKSGADMRSPGEALYVVDDLSSLAKLALAGFDFPEAKMLRENIRHLEFDRGVAQGHSTRLSDSVPENPGTSTPG